jgi:DNA-binding MarR family transcriptional regulator
MPAGSRRGDAPISYAEPTKGLQCRSCLNQSLQGASDRLGAVRHPGILRAMNTPYPIAQPTGQPTGQPTTDAAADMGPLPSMLFHALRQAEAAVLADLHAMLDGEALRPQGFAALVVIGRNPGLRQNQVGFALDIQRSNLVPLLDLLEARGLAERRAVPGDRRARGLFLTRLGAETLARLEAKAAAHEARLAARLGTGGRMQLVALLQRVSDAAFDPPE